MRILRIIDRLNVGGPSHHVLLLSRDLDRRGYHTVLTKGRVAPGEAEMDDVIAQTGVMPHVVPGLGRVVSVWEYVQAFWHLFLLCRRFRPHVVHTHKAVAGGLGRLAARLAGVPVVIHTFHGHIFHGYFSAWKSRLIVVFERLLAALCSDCIVSITKQQRDELLAYRITSPGRLACVPLGLALDEFVDRPRGDDGFRAELGFATDASLVGFVGRLAPIKGVDVLLHAARYVVDQMPTVRFVVVGGGELREALEALARRLELSAHVAFAGFRRDTPRIYGALDLVALSSHNEGLPVSLIEAQAAGCYAVATRVGGVPDLIASESVGLTVDKGDARALGEAMVTALRERRSVAEGIRRDAGRRYGIARLTDDLDRLYRRLLNRKCCPIAGAGQRDLQGRENS